MKEFILSASSAGNTDIVKNNAGKRRKRKHPKAINNQATTLLQGTQVRPLILVLRNTGLGCLSHVSREETDLGGRINRRMVLLQTKHRLHRSVLPLNLGVWVPSHGLPPSKAWTMPIWSWARRIYRGMKTCKTLMRCCLGSRRMEKTFKEAQHRATLAPIVEVEEWNLTDKYSLLTMIGFRRTITPDNRGHIWVDSRLLTQEEI